MNQKQEQIVDLFMQLMPKETAFKTSVKGLSMFRKDNSFSRVPFSYSSEIIILGQGEKNTYLGDNVYTYNPSNYLVLPVPLPLECEAKTDHGKPMLGLSIKIDPIEIGEILLEMQDIQKETQAIPKGIYSAPMNEALYDAVIRLLKAVSNPQDANILAPMIKREIIYRILQGEKGEVLQALANRNRRFYQIAKVLQKIHESYSDDFNVETLASELDMSSSAFHSSFKSVTDTSPLQYIKNIRLHKARNFMIYDGLNANMAALKVGYESASQFSREYKRLFRVTPAKDVAMVKI